MLVQVKLKSFMLMHFTVFWKIDKSVRANKTHSYQTFTVPGGFFLLLVGGSEVGETHVLSHGVGDVELLITKQNV